METPFAENEIVYDAYEPCGEQPPEKNSQRHWVEIELYYEDTGEPVAGEEYWVKVPDGVDRRGNLDANGFAREDGIDNPGNCEIRFPRLDREVWERG